MVQTCHIDHPTLNAQLKEEILLRRESDRGVVCHNQGGWHSERDALEWDSPGIKELLALVSERGPAGMELTLAWANINEAGHFNEEHMHAGGSFLVSGYYVVAGESGSTVFEPGEFAVAPVPGLLALFPSSQKHRVEPCNEQRITVAFNFARLRAATKE